MIKGIGIDIENTIEFKNWKNNNNFIKNLFSKKEIDYCLKKKEPHLSFTGKFCAKEAVIKACSQKITFKNIEILNDKKHKPFVYIDGIKKEKILCSITHCKEYAMAFVIIN